MKHSWRTLVTWIVVVLCGVMAGLGTVLWAQYDPAAGSAEVPFTVLAVAMPVVGAFIITRKPGNTVGLAMLLGGLSFAIDTLATGARAYVFSQTPVNMLLWNLGTALDFTFFAGAVFLLLMLALFPTGSFPTRRWRWVGIASILGVAMMFVATITSLLLYPPRTAPDNPYDEFLYKSSWALPFQYAWIGGIGLVCCGMLGAIVCIIVRFRRARGLERQQIKWVSLSGGAMLLIFALGLGVLLTGQGRQPGTAANAIVSYGIILSQLATVASIGIAILNHRLFDIDVVIRRTLIYSVFSVLLGAIYVGLITALQQGLTALTGRADSQLVTVASTLAVAGLFLPLRRGIQSFIDRRFYRTKYNAEQAVARFSMDMRDAVVLDDVSGKLFDAVESTLQPEKIVLWLPRDEKSRAKS